MIAIILSEIILVNIELNKILLNMNKIKNKYQLVGRLYVSKILYNFVNKVSIFSISFSNSKYLII